MTPKADISRLGRPRRGQNRLSKYAEDAEHPGMRLLALKAVRRGRTLEDLATAVGRDPRAVRLTLLAKKPRLDSVRDLVAKVMSELENPVLVARALLRALSDTDQRFARRLLNEVLQSRGHPEIHPETIKLAQKVREALAQSTPERQHDILCEFVVADAALDERDPVEAVAIALGVSSPDVDPAAKVRRQHEAVGALLWLLKLLGLEHRTRVAVARALEPSFRTFPLLREILFEHELDLEPALRDRIGDAIDAARHKFLEVMNFETPKASVPIKLTCIRKKEEK